jgi:hypothetical protein
MLEDLVELSSFVALFHYLKGVTNDVLIRESDFLSYLIFITFPFSLSPAKLKVLLNRLGKVMQTAQFMIHNTLVLTQASNSNTCVLDAYLAANKNYRR